MKDTFVVKRACQTVLVLLPITNVETLLCL